MSLLKCKNCGADVCYDKDKKVLVCEFCQTFHDVCRYNDGLVKCDSEKVSVLMIKKYNEALQIMETAKTENDYDICVNIFEQIGNLFDSKYLLKECILRRNSLKKENEYALACQRMKSTNPEILINAYEIFLSLGDYKDSKDKAYECNLLYKQNEDLENINRLNIEKQEKAQKAREKAKKFLNFFIVLLLVIITACGYLFYKYINEKKYSRDNISMNFSAVENDFCVERGNSYIFSYNVIIENNGKVGIESIEGTVAFEDENGNLLVSADIYFSNYPITVAAGEKRKYLWELSVYSLDDAQKLFYIDEDDLVQTVNISKVVFADGKTMDYNDSH